MEDFKHKGPEHTEKFKAGRHRTYFFDVYSTRKGEYYLTVTESKKRADGKGYERHKIFLYKEDLNRFLEMLTQSVNQVKDRMPEYDYDEFARRQAEWENQRDSVKSADSNEMDEPEMSNEQDMPEEKAVAPTYHQTESPKVQTPQASVVEPAAPSQMDEHSHDDMSW